MDLSKVYQQIQVLTEKREDFVVITITKVIGSAPQDLGAKLIFWNENFVGTVGGGKVEAHCLEFAKGILQKKGIVQSHKWNLQKDIGMTCGGEVEFLFEPHYNASNWNIAIFGAGHVAQALSRVLQMMNCNLYVFDTRSEWIDKLEKAERTTAIVVEDMAAQVVDLPEQTYIISMTRGHAVDVPILAAAFKKEKTPYIGVIGSQSKRNAIENDLVEFGISKEELSRLVCPIGEPIGSNDPVEIAISIISQLLKLRDQD